MAVALENELSFLRKKIRTNRWCTVGTIDCHISGVVLVTGNTVVRKAVLFTVLYIKSTSTSTRIV